MIGGALRASGRDLPGGPIRRLATLHLYTRATLALRLHRRIDLRLLRSFDGVIAVTAELAAELEQSVERRAVAGGRRRVARRVIPNGIDAADLRARAAADLPAVRAELAAGSERQGEGRAPVLIAGGRLTRQKGLDLLLEALPAVVARHPGLVLWIAGEGPERPALAAQADRLGLAGRVRFLGERGDLAALFSAADGFVLPSRSEGSPYVLLEAMALGLPVVAAAVGGVATMLADGARGLLVRAGEPRSSPAPSCGCWRTRTTRDAGRRSRARRSPARSRPPAWWRRPPLSTPRSWVEEPRLRVVMIDPGAFTPFYDDALCRGLAAEGCDVELVTAPFAYHPWPAARGYARREVFAGGAGGAGAGRAGLRLYRRLRRAITYPVVWRKLVAELARRPPEVVHLQWSLAAGGGAPRPAAAARRRCAGGADGAQRPAARR